MKIILAALLLANITAAYAESDNCVGTSSKTLDELTSNVCTATSSQIADDLGKDKKSFDKIYSGSKSGYQSKLISSAASVDSKAEKNNYNLWLTAQTATIFSNISFDEKGKSTVSPTLLRLVQQTMGFKSDESGLARANAHIEANITPYAKLNKTISGNGSTFSVNLQKKFLHTVMTDPKFASLLKDVKSNVGSALKSLPNNTFADKDVEQTFESAKKVSNLEINNQPSPTDKAYWESKYNAENPFLDQNSQAYQVHYKAYTDYKANLTEKFNNRKNVTEKEMKEELASIELRDPKKISFTPPTGVNVDDFFNQIKDNNPSYFNCKVSYTADATIQKNIIKSSTEKTKPEDEVLSMPSVQAKTCKLQNNFGDDQYAMSGDMASEVAACLKDIPSDAYNVKIDVQSCASTVRTNKEEFNKSNLLLSQKRSESIAKLVPSNKGYALSLNYKGENKMIDSSGNLSPTGTCGPWVQGVGDYNMDPTSCINSMKSSDGYCDNTPKHIIKSDGFYWLCNQVDGKPYDEKVKASLKDYRFNTIKISYELKPVVDEVPSEKGFDPSRLPEDKKLSYIESTPHITCLFPRLSHENWTSFSDRMKNSWRDFTEFTSSLSFQKSGSAGGGESHTGSNGLCAAYQ